VIWRATWVIGGVLALLGGCDAPVPPPVGVASAAHAGPPERGGWLRMASYTDVRTLDSAVAFDEGSNPIEHLIYAQLIEFSPDGKGFVPDLAARHEISEDGRRYTFHLRENALFHDGQPVLAADVKRSMERALHPDTPCPVSSFYERIVGYREFTKRQAPEIRGIVVTGERSLAIELSEPDATLLAVLALPIMAPVCRSAGHLYDRDFSSHPCGAGPFKMVSWEPGRVVRVERFAGYYDPALPYLDGVEWSIAVPTFTQRFKFESGQLDYLREFSETDLLRYLASPAWKGQGQWEPSKGVHSIFMNTEMAPFDSVELRRAVASAINRDEVAAIRPGSIHPASRIIPPAIPGYNPEPGQRFDLPAALEHMRKAGFPYDPATGRGGYPRELSFLAVGDSFDTEAAQIYQQQLARIGIRLRIRATGWPAYLAESSRRKTVAFGSDGWSADYPDPGNFFEPLFTAAAITEEESQNRAFYVNPALDQLLEEARKELDQTRRFALYKRAEDMVLDDAPWAVTYTKRWYELWQPYLHGYKIHPAVTQRIGFTWLDQKARAQGAVGWAAPPLPGGRLAGLLPAHQGPRARP
jgi:ABC-type transport system substrate-binding protein